MTKMGVKRLLSLFLACMIAGLSSPASAGASLSDWDISEAGITIGIPDDYIVLSRDNLDSHKSFLKDIGYTKESMQEYMIAQNIFLDCIADNFDGELVVCALDSDGVSNFTHLSDSMVLAQVSVFKEQYKQSGIDLYKSEIYENSHAKFAVCFLKGSSGYGMEYYTVYDGICISITFNNFLGPFKTTDIAKGRSIVDSVRFHAEGNNTDTGASPSFLYTDTKTGTSFTVPDNWEQRAFTQPHEKLDVMFGSSVDSVVSIMYGSTDVYAEAVAKDSSLKREDVDISKLKDEEIEEFVESLSVLSSKTNTFKKVLYGSTEYLLFNYTQTSSAYGMEISIDLVMLCTVRNGFFYVFSFGESEGSPYYNDFISLMNSVRYRDEAFQENAPVATGAPVQQASDNPAIPAGNDGGKRLSNGHIMILASLAVIITIIGTAVIVNSAKKHADKKQTTERYESSPHNQGNDENREIETDTIQNQHKSEKAEIVQAIGIAPDVSAAPVKTIDNSMEAEYTKAIELLRMPTNENIESSVKTMEKLAGEANYLPAIKWMGKYSEEVLGDYKKAMEWFKLAAMYDRDEGK